VADIGTDRTYAYKIQPDGALAGKRLACAMGSDGMTVDTDGNLYLTGHGVFVFDKTGRQIDRIEVPEPWVGNLCFGGRDKQTLFLAASKSLYSIRLTTKGANPAK
jgi:gluconolactonase